MEPLGRKGEFVRGIAFFRTALAPKEKMAKETLVQELLGAKSAFISGGSD